MRFRKYLATMVAGFAGAALLLGVAYAAGVVGGGTTTVKTVQGQPAAFKTTGMTAQQIYEQNVGGVVEIKSTFPGKTDIFGQSTGVQQGIGTGFVVSRDGLIMTNAHVVSESGQAATSVTVIFKGSGSDGTQVAGTIVGADESTDVALIQIDPSQAPTLVPVTLGDSSKVAVGEEVVAIGNPLGLDFSLSSGVVSATDRELQSPNGATITGGIQTDAAINPGNSGGPLFDANGNVIGINEQIDFAVPINTAVSVMKQMQDGTFRQQSQTPSDGSQYYQY
jgi:putative serine protease PepD